MDTDQGWSSTPRHPVSCQGVAMAKEDKFRPSITQRALWSGCKRSFVQMTQERKQNVPGRCLNLLLFLGEAVDDFQLCGGDLTVIKVKNRDTYVALLQLAVQGVEILASRPILLTCRIQCF